MCVYTIASFFCTTETNTTFQVNYIPIKIKKIIIMQGPRTRKQESFLLFKALCTRQSRAGFHTKSHKTTLLDSRHSRTLRGDSPTEGRRGVIAACHTYVQKQGDSYSHWRSSAVSAMAGTGVHEFHFFFLRQPSSIYENVKHASALIQRCAEKCTKIFVRGKKRKQFSCS